MKNILIILLTPLLSGCLSVSIGFSWETKDELTAKSSVVTKRGFGLFYNGEDTTSFDIGYIKKSVVSLNQEDDILLEKKDDDYSVIILNEED